MTIVVVWVAANYRIVYVPAERSLRLLTVSEVASGKLPGEQRARKPNPYDRFTDVEAVRGEAARER